MKVDRARAQDLPDVLSLLSASSLPLDGVERHFDSFLVARGENKSLCGVIGLEAYGDVGLLRSLAVDDRCRGRGLGRTLVERLVELARDRGVATMYLLTTTAEDYFPRVGFEAVDRNEAHPSLDQSEELRGACPSTAVLMRRQI